MPSQHPVSRHVAHPDPAAAILRAAQQVTCDLGDEVVILNVTSGACYGFEGVGAAIWALLEKPRSVQGLLDAILNRYEIDPARCREDLLAALSQLEVAGLIRIEGDAG